MLINAADEIVRDPDIKRAADPAGEDVNPVTLISRFQACVYWIARFRGR
jgi:hypothetical protein